MQNLSIRRPSVVTAVRLGAVLLATMMAAAVLIARSDAAFTARTDNTGNALNSGLLVLEDNDGGTAMFSVTGMIPGELQQRCIKVEYNGTLDAAKLVPVRIFASVPGTLDPYLLSAIEMGTTGSNTFSSANSATSCSSFGGTVSQLYNNHQSWNQSLDLASLIATHGTYATGLGTGWTPATAGDARWFRISFSVKDVDAAQNLNSTPSFTWELRTTP